MKNKLTDLNDILFEQLERLNDEELTPEKLEAEIERSRALTGVADKIIDNATLQLEAANFMVAHGAKQGQGKLPRVMGLLAGADASAPGAGGAER